MSRLRLKGPAHKSFDWMVAGRTPDESYTFGSAAVAPDGGVAITSQTVLETYFNAFQDYIAQTTSNAELQRYKAFNADNHAFATDRLNLTGICPSWTTIVSGPTGAGVNLDGTATAIANLGLANTTGLRVGQLAAVQYKGLYRISALVADTSVTLTNIASSTSATTGNLIAWLPIDTATLSGAFVDHDATLTFSSVPSDVAAGHMIAIIDASANLFAFQDWRVDSIDSGVVTVNMDMGTGFDMPIGTRIVFIPPITSGQIWGKAQYDITSQSSFFAMELECDLYTGGTPNHPTLNV